MATKYGEVQAFFKVDTSPYFVAIGVIIEKQKSPMEERP